jgi:RimJ/RimL family protein N-acetyltransferase
MSKPGKKTCVRLRPAIASDLPDIIGEPLPCRIRAITVLADDRVIGMGGIAFPPYGPAIAFVQQTAEAKNHPVAFHRAGLLAMQMIRDAGIMQVVATTDRDNPTAIRWIRRLGFVTSAVQPFEHKLLFEWNRDDTVVVANERTTAYGTGPPRAQVSDPTP